MHHDCIKKRVPDRGGHRGDLHRCGPAVRSDRGNPDRKGPVDPRRSVAGLPRCGGPDSRPRRRAAGRHLLPRPRHHGGDERPHRGEDAAHRVPHHRGVSRSPRDRPAGEAIALRRPFREAGLHGRVGTRRRGHRVQPHRRGARAPERDLVRHGGNDREGRPHPRRAAQHHQGVRGRRASRARNRPGARERLPDSDPGHRPRRDAL